MPDVPAFGHVKKGFTPAVVFELYDDGTGDHVFITFLEGMWEVGSQKVDIVCFKLAHMVANKA